MQGKNSKNANSSKIENAKIEKINFENLNLEFSKLERGIGGNRGESIYNFPLIFKGKEYLKLDKEIRGKLRNERDRLILSFIWNNQKKDIAGMEKSFEDFKKFYKEFYRKNDFSMDSISNNSHKDSISNKISKKDLEIFLSFCKKMNES